MSPRAILVVLLAVATGGLSVVGVTQMQGTAAATQTAPAVTPIVVMTATAPRGATLAAEMLELKDWPRDFVPAGTLTKLDEAVGRVCLQPLLPGEPLLTAKLAAPGSSRSAGNLIRPGMRAYSIIASTLATSVAGLVLPGDHVDVILTVQSNTNDESGGGTSTTLLQNIEILALDQVLEAPAENRGDPGLKSVTLLVAQREAALLGLGQKMGVLSLSLRNPEDTEQAKTEPVTLAELRFRQEAPETPAEPGPSAGAVALSLVNGFWDRLDQSLDKAAAARESAAAPAEVVAAPAPLPPAPPRVGVIRTLRGSQSGVVLVNYGE